MNKEAIVLIPCYDPDETIMANFLKELSKSFANIVIIDDGCNATHEKFMNSLSKKYDIVKHHVNLGKGRGIKNGINYILNNYPESNVIVTADCDGQHTVKDIKKCMKASLAHPSALILGVRNLEDMPFRSKCGNTITKNILYNMVGAKISDTQTGLRAMSLSLAKELIATPGERYEYETNVLIETKKKDIEVVEVPIETIYINDNKTSHFNPIKDSARIYKFFASYIIVTLLAYIIETYIFAGTYDLFNPLIGIPLFLLLSKIISSLIISLLNKHVNLIYTALNYLITLIILFLVNNHLVIIKVLVDLIMLILSLFFTKFNTTKEQ